MVQAIIERVAIRLEPDNRYHSGANICTRLDLHVQGGVNSRQPTTFEISFSYFIMEV